MQRFLIIFLLGCGFLLAACGESSAPAGDSGDSAESPASEAADPATEAATAPEQDAEAAGPELAGIEEGAYTSFGENANVNACEPEVIEVFSYTCIHCYNFEEILTPWAEAAEQRGIRFERMPLAGNQAMTTWARVYVAMKELAPVEQFHHAVFDRLHGEGQEPIRSLDELMAFVQELGVDGEAFQTTFESDQVTEVLQSDYELMRAAQVRATPTMLVNRRYKLEPTGGDGFQNMLATVEQLIERDRAAAGCPASDA